MPFKSMTRKLKGGSYTKNPLRIRGGLLERQGMPTGNWLENKLEKLEKCY